MCHFLTVPPLNHPCRVTMLWGCPFLSLVSPQKFSIPFSDLRKTSYPLRPPHKPITTSSTGNDILLFFSWSTPFHYTPHPAKSAFTTSEVTPKSPLFMTPILNLDLLMNLPNHIPCVGNTISVKFYSSHDKIVSPIPNFYTPYKSAHALGAFHMLSQWRRPTYLPLRINNLKVTDEIQIPNSSVNG